VTGHETRVRIEATCSRRGAGGVPDGTGRVSECIVNVRARGFLQRVHATVQALPLCRPLSVLLDACAPLWQPIAVITFVAASSIATGADQRLHQLTYLLCNCCKVALEFGAKPCNITASFVCFPKTARAESSKDVAGGL
jgi:hypothetical protein